MIGIIGIRDTPDRGKNSTRSIILSFVEFNFETNPGNFLASTFRDDVGSSPHWAENLFGYKKRTKGLIFLSLIDLPMAEIEPFCADLKVDVSSMF